MIDTRMSGAGQHQVFVSGAASWNSLVDLDRLPDSRSQTIAARGDRQALGGTSAGKALNLARLGFDVTLKTCLGRDDAAIRIRDALDVPGLRVIDVGDDDTPTERHLNLMSADGGRVSIYLASAGEIGVPMPPDAVAALTVSDVAVLDLADHTLAAIPVARDLGVPIWVDLHDWDGTDAYRAPFAAAADVIQFSGDLLDDPVPLMRDRVERGARLVVCTQGSRGMVAVDADGVHEQPPIPVQEVVDTNGAGDACLAGILFGRLNGFGVAASLRYGAIAGALAVGSVDLAAPSLTPAMLLHAGD